MVIQRVHAGRVHANFHQRKPYNGNAILADIFKPRYFQLFYRLSAVLAQKAVAYSIVPGIRPVPISLSVLAFLKKQMLFSKYKTIN